MVTTKLTSRCPLAKRLGTVPRELAAKVVEGTEFDGVCETPEIAGPGFINLKLTDEFIIKKLQAFIHDERIGVERANTEGSIVVDFSSPNVAKPMHVGHIRSTVIGDSLAKVLGFWGTTSSPITISVIGDPVWHHYLRVQTLW